MQQGFEPDFWMKTLHHTNYWSAQVETEHDNIYCRQPAEVVAFMESLPQPWIAFKTLAAGDIQPKEGFRGTPSKTERISFASACTTSKSSTTVTSC